MSLPAVIFPIFYVALCFLLLVLTAVGWGRKMPLAKWIFTIALISLASLPFISSIIDQYPYLRTPPREAELFGTYSIAPESASQYFPGKSTVTLKPDHTIIIDKIPHAWLTGRSRSGKDSCFGTWKAANISGTTTYSIVVQNFGFSDDSARVISSDPGYSELGWLSFDILDKTFRRKNYALAAPINYGDEGYIYFLKTDSNAK